MDECATAKALFSASTRKANERIQQLMSEKGYMLAEISKKNDLILNQSSQIEQLLKRSSAFDQLLSEHQHVQALRNDLLLQVHDLELQLSTSSEMNRDLQEEVYRLRGTDNGQFERGVLSEYERLKSSASAERGRLETELQNAVRWGEAHAAKAEELYLRNEALEGQLVEVRREWMKQVELFRQERGSQDGGAGVVEREGADENGSPGGTADDMLQHSPTGRKEEPATERRKLEFCLEFLRGLLGLASSSPSKARGDKDGSRHSTFSASAISREVAALMESLTEQLETDAALSDVEQWLKFKEEVEEVMRQSEVSRSHWHGDDGDGTGQERRWRLAVSDEGAREQDASTTTVGVDEAFLTGSPTSLTSGHTRPLMTQTGDSLDTEIFVD